MVSMDRQLSAVIRALLFDAAGTLIEPAEPVAEVYARHAAAHGLDLETGRVETAFAGIFRATGDPEWDLFPEGDPAEQEWWRRLVEKTLCHAAGHTLDARLVERCFLDLFACYADPAAWRVFPEVPEVLSAARDGGFRLAVVSNFDLRLHGILKGHGLAFDAVVTSADARSRKPDPGVFHHALRALGIEPGEAFHAGDSLDADLGGARASGIRAFLLERPDNSLRDFLHEASARRGE